MDESRTLITSMPVRGGLKCFRATGSVIRRGDKEVAQPALLDGIGAAVGITLRIPSPLTEPGCSRCARRARGRQPWIESARTYPCHRHVVPGHVAAFLWASVAVFSRCHTP
jgi:hypothetical protein